MNARGEPPRVHARRVIAENAYVRYVEEDLDPRGDGGRYTYYQLETTADAVVVVPRLSDGRYLLERVYRHPHRRWYVEWPAGGIDPGEEVLAAAARELREETGHAAARLRVLGTVAPLAGLVRIGVSVVLAEDCQRVGDAQLEDLELIELFTASAEELPGLGRETEVSGLFIFGCHFLDSRARA